MAESTFEKLINDALSDIQTKATAKLQEFVDNYGNVTSHDDTAKSQSDMLIITADTTKRDVMSFQDAYIAKTIAKITMDTDMTLTAFIDFVRSVINDDRKYAIKAVKQPMPDSMTIGEAKVINANADALQSLIKTDLTVKIFEGIAKQYIQDTFARHGTIIDDTDIEHLYEKASSQGHDQNIGHIASQVIDITETLSRLRCL